MGEEGSFPSKQRLPDPVDGDVMKWRRWRKSFLRFVDSEVEGIQGLLEKTEDQPEEPSPAQCDEELKSMGKEWLIAERTKLRCALVKLPKV